MALISGQSSALDTLTHTHHLIKYLARARCIMRASRHHSLFNPQSSSFETFPDCCAFLYISSLSISLLPFFFCNLTNRSPNTRNVCRLRRLLFLKRATCRRDARARAPSNRDERLRRRDAEWFSRMSIAKPRAANESLTVFAQHFLCLVVYVVWL